MTKFSPGFALYDKIVFTALAPWPGDYLCAEGRYAESDGSEKRAGIFIGPEFGTVNRSRTKAPGVENVLGASDKCQC
ncbi:MAG: hypothetical protein ACLQMO_04285 [Acidobacteriaceae bacterium]